MAAAILEVLAGARTPTEAATALGLSVPRYYQVETQALRGLLQACEPKPRGRVRTVETEVKTLSKENQRLQRELTRHQALARAAQRAVGLAPPAPVVSKTGKKPAQASRGARLERRRALEARDDSDDGKRDNLSKLGRKLTACVAANSLIREFTATPISAREIVEATGTEDPSCVDDAP